MIKNIVIVLVLAVAGFSAYVAFQPAEYKITRSATIAAPADTLFSFVNNFTNWQKWSPWADLDPDQKTSFEGPDAGEGAVMSWEGNSDVGAGKMTITSSRPVDLIKMQLDFKKPMEAVGYVTFTFDQQAEGTFVTWTHEGKNSFIGKAFAVVMNMDKCLGEQFEKGFENLRKLVNG